MPVGVATAIGTLCNVVPDWLFVLPLEMGLMGAALATGISWTVTLVIVLFHFLQRKGALSFGRFRGSGALYRKLIFRGLPEMIAQFATPVTTICMNRVLLACIGEIGVNSFSIISYVASFTMSVLFGSSEGLQPLFGQSCGAKDEEGLKY